MGTRGKRLKKLRIEYEKRTGQNNLLSHIAQQYLGIDPSTLWRYENNKVKNIPDYHLEMLSKLYNTTEEYILEGENSEEATKIPTLEDILYCNTITFKGKLLTRQEKEVLLKFGGDAINLIRDNK